MALFTTAELQDFLGYDVPDAQATMAERVVSGWFAEEGLDYSDQAATVPPQVFSWAIELGGIYHENPTSQTTDATTGQTQSWYGARRAEILAAVRRYAARINDTPAGDAVGNPRGYFPPPNYLGRF